MTMTSGTGLLFHNFDHFGPKTQATDIGQRRNGVMISMDMGKCLAYSLFNLQERGRMMAEPSDEVYEGQIVGIHSRDNDRSEEHTSELQSLMRISYAVFCLKKKQTMLPPNTLPYSANHQ